MPEKKQKVDGLLEEALSALTRGLTKSGAPWMVIGGIAIIARGVRRFTTDIDAAVRGDAVGPAELLASLSAYGIEPRIPDALTFAEANLVLLLRHQPTGVDLDLSFAWSAFEHGALATATLTSFGRVRAPMCTVENLVVFKTIAGRPKDVDDAGALLALYPQIDRAYVRAHVATLAELAEAPELLDVLEEVLRA